MWLNGQGPNLPYFTKSSFCALMIFLGYCFILSVYTTTLQELLRESCLNTITKGIQELNF